jgi:TonB family protein
VSRSDTTPQGAPGISPSTAPKLAPVDSKSTPASRSSNTCLVAIWVRASGAVQAAQVVSSSGAPRLDEACARAVINQQLMPATIAGVAIDKWVVLPIKWDLKFPAKKLPPAKQPNEAPIPRLADEQELHVDPPYYPASAVQERQEGICTMHVIVSAAGDVEHLALTRSTGVNSLDTACQDALYAAQFIPAKRDGQTIEAATDVWLAWRLPRAVTNAP